MVVIDYRTRYVYSGVNIPPCLRQIGNKMSSYHSIAAIYTVRTGFWLIVILFDKTHSGKMDECIHDCEKPVRIQSREKVRSYLHKIIYFGNFLSKVRLPIVCAQCVLHAVCHAACTFTWTSSNPPDTSGSDQALSESSRRCRWIDIESTIHSKEENVNGHVNRTLTIRYHFSWKPILGYSYDKHMDSFETLCFVRGSITQ